MAVARMSANDITYYLESDDCVVGTWHAVAFVSLRVVPTLALLRPMEAAQRDILSRFGGRAAWISLMDGMRVNRLDFSEEARRTITEMFGRPDKNVFGVATVLEGKGLWIGGMRAILTGAAMAARIQFPHKVFDEAALACDWLGERMASDSDFRLSSSELLARVEETRQRLR